MNHKKYLEKLPNRQTLKKICKGRAVLDWIICGHEFETYHTYFKSNQDEYDGIEAQIGLDFEEEDGVSLSFYFEDEGCLIVPSPCIPTDRLPNNREFEKRIPKIFLPYFKKNFSNLDIPFVIWNFKDDKWHYEQHFDFEENIDKFDQLTLDPKVYKKWAVDFFGEETHLREDMKENTISNIYEGKVLTESMVFDIVTEVEDWMDLEEELDNIPYRFDF